MIIAKLMIYCALSLRSPSIEPNPFDYEVSGGYKIESVINSEALFLYERENGIRYNGRIHEHSTKYLLISEYYKEAKEISKQKAIIKYPVKCKLLKSETGIGGEWDYYKNGSFIAWQKISNKVLSIEAVYNFVKFTTLKGKLGYKYFISDRIYVEPKGIYFTDFDKDDYQFKLEVGYEWAQKN